MVTINIDSARRELIMKEYCKSVSVWLEKTKRKGPKDTKANSWFKYFQDNLDEIVCCPANELENRYEKFLEDKEINNQNDLFYSIDSYTSYMKSLYSTFMCDANKEGKQHAYWLLEQLGISVCPYCNRAYTTSIYIKENNDIKKVRPDFDHFLSEDKFPLFTLSFYNLIPSCHQCNRLKLTEQFDHNPWMAYSKDQAPRFKIDLSDGDFFPSVPKVLIENESKETQHLLIRELYNTAHVDYVKELLLKIEAYSNPEVFQSVADAFQGIATPSELQRIIWGNFVLRQDNDKRPLAKLTCDILEQWGMLPEDDFQ